jgi:hypothetical protein
MQPLDSAVISKFFSSEIGQQLFYANITQHVDNPKMQLIPSINGSMALSFLAAHSH